MIGTSANRPEPTHRRSDNKAAAKWHLEIKDDDMRREGLRHPQRRRAPIDNSHAKAFKFERCGECLSPSTIVVDNHYRNGWNHALERSNAPQAWNG